MQRKAFRIYDLKVEDERVVKGLFAIHGNVDGGRDRIENGAWAKTLAEVLPAGRVKVLWQHDAEQPPIGVPLTVKEVGKSGLPRDLLTAHPEATGGLYGEWRALSTQRANEVLEGIRAGAITENSIGYDPIKIEYDSDPDGPVRRLKELKLYDISPVNWGMNPATTNLKAALPFKKTPMADIGASWDGPAAMRDCDGAEQLRLICAWVDSNGDPDVKSSYKLPHHTPDGKVVWKGVAAAMGALLGSRGGVDIPESDRHGVYNHLRGHYEQFDKEPPDFKFLQFVWVTKEWKAGRVLSAATIDRIGNHAQTMKDHLGQMDSHMTGINESIDALTNWIAGNEPETEIQKSEPLNLRFTALASWFDGAEPAQPLTPEAGKSEQRTANRDGSNEPAATPLVPDDLKQRLATLDSFFTP